MKLDAQMLMVLMFFVPFGCQRETFNKEVVVQHEVVEGAKVTESYTKAQLALVESAKEVVKKYWVSSHAQVYELFSDGYKDRLRKIDKLASATDYAKSFEVTERVWLRQTYEKIDIQEDDFIQIVVASDWEEEGYEGVMTFIFDMTKEKGNWKIESVVF